MLDLFGRVGERGEERLYEVLILPVERVSVDEEYFERIEAREPGRDSSKTIVSDRERVKASEVGQGARKGRETAAVGDEDEKRREGAEERRECRSCERIAVDVEFLQ